MELSEGGGNGTTVIALSINIFLKKSLNLTTAPTSYNRNHITTTIPCIPLSLHHDIIILLILRPPFTPSWLSLLWWSTPDPKTFFLVLPANPAHIPVHAVAPTASKLYFWPYQKEAGKGLWTVCIKSTVLCNDFLSLHIHSALTHWLSYSNLQSCKLHSQ